MEEQMSRLSRDLLAEILSRLPYKSLCICKSVCLTWRDLIADPEYRKKVTQSLVGFFYQHDFVDKDMPDYADPCGFSVAVGVTCADLSAFPWAAVPRACPHLPLPPDSMDCRFYLQDSCDGLFLTRIRTSSAYDPTYRYVVSNPATGEYALLPHYGYDGNRCSAYLGFDSAASTQEFYVLELLIDWQIHFWQIYSSKTGAWVSSQSKWDVEATLSSGQPAVFNKGCLHLLMKLGLAVVDLEGLTWRTIPAPKFIDPSFSGCIGKSAGQLLYINSDDCLVYGANLCSTISVYILSAEVYQSDAPHLDDDCMEHWKLLHKISNISPESMFQFGFDLRVIGVHPHANIIFVLAHSNYELVAYDLDRRESTIVYQIQYNYQKFMQFFSYVPLLSGLPLDGGMRLAVSR